MATRGFDDVVRVIKYWSSREPALPAARSSAVDALGHIGASRGARSRRTGSAFDMFHFVVWQIYKGPGVSVQSGGPEAATACSATAARSVSLQTKPQNTESVRAMCPCSPRFYLVLVTYACKLNVAPWRRLGAAILHQPGYLDGMLGGSRRLQSHRMRRAT
ncbi:hypothetical protein ColTof4_10124 [Colletotrichum tofieldiae]|nr:hypothetical protein ColTof3_06214 [Colletotrichum tofieldiae]GKT77701.1 hypothetical protein ColTof4_10124 [Colletotrichum tofieldiae]GKT85008.1 hypothetical protein Ct61P_02858 [Colletotrichum tofieldiae]